MGTVVLSGLAAVDGDQAGRNSEIRYSVVEDGGPGAELLTVPRPWEGSIAIKRRIDFEALRNFTVAIRAQVRFRLKESVDGGMRNKVFAGRGRAAVGLHGSPPRHSARCGRSESPLRVPIILSSRLSSSGSGCTNLTPLYSSDFKPGRWLQNKTLNVLPRSILATDQDTHGAAILYTLSGAVADRFALQPRTGEIRQIGPLKPGRTYTLGLHVPLRPLPALLFVNG